MVKLRMPNNHLVDIASPIQIDNAVLGEHVFIDP